MNFKHLGLKKIICTCYAGSPISYTELRDAPSFEKNKKLPYKIEITEIPDVNNDGAMDFSDIELLLRSNKNNLTILDGDGDFRSEESIEFLKEADVVVTNPPFSLFREYVSQLVEYGKKFLILSNMNALHYKEIFPLIKEGKMWAGYSFNKTMEFVMPDDYKLKGKAYIDKDGKKHGFVPAICWFTNIDIEKRHNPLILYKKYSEDEYDRFDELPQIININKVIEMPVDYDGYMAVPITFLDKYSPDQFEIIDALNRYTVLDYFGINEDVRRRHSHCCNINGHSTYSRIVIRRKYEDRASEN